MSSAGWSRWQMYADDPKATRLEDLTLCSPNYTYYPCYVVGMYDNTNNINRLGYVYYYERLKSFSNGYFMEETDRTFTTSDWNPFNECYFFRCENFSFRPHSEVPENLWFGVGPTKEKTPMYIGTIQIGIEELCGPVINGVCYSNSLGEIFSSEEFKVLALNEE